MSSLPKIIAVVGTNASGKSALGIELAKRFDGEVSLLRVDEREPQLLSLAKKAAAFFKISFSSLISLNSFVMRFSSKSVSEGLSDALMPRSGLW